MDQLEKYINDLSEPQDEVLEALEKETYLNVLNPRMISGHIQGKFLEFLVRMIRPRNILEIGSFTGYSAICMARGMEDGACLDTYEIDDELELLIKKFINLSRQEDKICLHIGSALELAPLENKVYDLVFIDGDKREYPAYYNMLFEHRMVHLGSIIIADNILWYGKVAKPVEHNDRHTAAIVEFNAMVREDERVENVILPLRDGLNILRVKSL